MSFSIINIPHFRDGDTIPPATQPREKTLFSHIHTHQSVILYTRPSTFFSRIPVLLTTLSATILVQGANIPQLNYCSSLLADCPASFHCRPTVSSQHSWQCDPVKMSGLVFLLSQASQGFLSHSVKAHLLQ